MADPLSIVAGVAGTTAFALSAVVKLIETIKSVKSTSDDIADLNNDIESLEVVLDSLAKLVDDFSDQFVLLEFPLRCCGRTCLDLERLVQPFTLPSRFKLLDWAKLRIKGQDISTLKKNLAVYKSTICIAIGGLNLQQSLATRELVSDYQDLVVNTTKALRGRIDHLASALTDGQEESEAIEGSPHTLTRSELLEEKEGAELCLRICNQVAGSLLEFGARIKPTHDRVMDASSNKSEAARGVPARMTYGKLEQVSADVRSLSAQLEQLHKRYDHLLARGNAEADPPMTREEIAELKTGFSHCLSVCQQGTQAAASARISEYENISGGARAHQWILSNFGDLLRVKDAKVQDDGLQIIGQVDSDVSRQLSSDYARLRQSSSARAESSVVGSTPTTQRQEESDESSAEFIVRHGGGSRLG